jgi:hypothetical protein
MVAQNKRKMKMEYDSVAQLDAELLNPALGLETRAALMARRITLDQLARAPAPRVEAPTGFRVIIPNNLPISDIIDGAGRKYQAIAVGDRREIDITPAVFRTLLAGPNGLDWERAQDSDVFERMQPGLHRN